ncbi:flagellar brake protein [Cohnella faecalis]|uniref:Glycosyl transferase n=1 Tax=Cohnella faecalis TaxID=2315694 RepID=A0A398CZI4_9BACL|nr:flagellar brake domain-containing protein [Cohnella faecalis]RIE04621.1 glycosyl transferase [Cohnella faecalis]
MLPKINQMLFLQALPDSEGIESVTFRSRVADQDERTIFIEIPLDEKSRRYHRCHVGEPFRVYFFTQEGVKHIFETEVTGVRKDTVSMVAIRKPALEDISRDQRRSFLRVEAALELAVRFDDKLRFVAITDDVGGGGLSFRCDRKWPIVNGAVLSCWLLVPYKGGTIAHAKFEGEIVRVLPVEPDKHLVMMRFSDIQDSDQQKIIRYCFERQLDNRKE